MRGIIIDSGSQTLKAGFAGEDSPSCVIPTAINQDLTTDKHSIKTMCYPVDKGIVVDWDTMESLWQEVFETKLLTEPNSSISSHPILLTEPPLNPKANREKALEVLFEKFDAPAMYMAVQSVLALYASGCTSGLVLDVGDGASHAVPVFEGYTLSHAITEVPITGQDLTDSLRIALKQTNCYTFKSAIQSDNDARFIKENLCNVSIDFDEQLTQMSTGTKTFELPDGQLIEMEQAGLTRCPESLFQPSLLGKSLSSLGIHQAVHSSILKSSVDIRRDLYCNIVLAGGSTLFPGLTERMSHELSKLVPSTKKARLIVPPERHFSVWIGGSILASILDNMWITKEEYNENGPSVVHKKCL